MDKLYYNDLLAYQRIEFIQDILNSNFNDIAKASFIKQFVNNWLSGDEINELLGGNNNAINQTTTTRQMDTKIQK